MYETIKEFISTPPSMYDNRRQWFTLPFLEVYLRVGHSLIGQDLVNSVTVSNFGLLNMEDEGKGHFKTFIIELEADAKEAGYDFIKFENAQPVLTASLLKNGYSERNPEQTTFMLAHTVSKSLRD